MADTSAGPSGAAPPKHFRSQASLHDRLSRWERRTGGESLAALTQEQQDSVMDIAIHVDQRPVPKGLISGAADDRHSMHGETPPRQRTGKQLGVPSRVETTQQFFGWYEELEAQKEAEAGETFRAYTGLLVEYRDRCKEILREISGALAHLRTLQAQYSSVAEKTSTLHDDCEHLLQEQSSLTALADSITSRLGYFNNIDTMSASLDNSSLSVLSEKFSPFLHRLDECIEYMGAHPEYKESAAYLARFRRLQGRALNLVKLHVVNTLKMATQHVVAQTQGDVSKGDKTYTLFYGKFRLHAPRIKALMEQLEKRAERDDSYLTLVQDCYSCFFSQRLSLLRPNVQRAVDTLTTQHKDDLPRLVREGCTFMMNTCRNEFQLYGHFFSAQTPGLDAMLEELTTILYDVTRPLVLHRNLTIDTLVELCTILNVGVIDDGGESTAAFVSVASEMLQDVQTRLVYRAQQYVRSHITGFVPGPQDLDYPKKLLEEAGADASSDHLGLASWYPTLSRSLLLLSQLYRCLDRKVCEAEAQELLQACMASLEDGYRAISVNQGTAHGQLFLIKHLLTLREQIAPFDVDFTVKEISLDFTPLREAAAGFVKHSGGLFRMDSTNPILGFFAQGLPGVRETRSDARREIDQRLKTVCQEYIQAVSKFLTGDINSFLTKAQAVAAAGGSKLPEHAFASPEKVHELVERSDAILRSELAASVQQMHLYLKQTETVQILFRPVQETVLATYERLLALIEQSYPTSEDRAIIGCPPLEQVRLTISLRGKMRRPTPAIPEAATPGAPAAEAAPAEAAPDSTAVTQPDSSAVTQPDSSAVTQPDSSAVTQPDSSTVTQPDSSAVTQPDSSAVTQPDSTAVTQPDSSAVTQPAAEAPDVSSIQVARTSTDAALPADAGSTAGSQGGV